MLFWIENLIATVITVFCIVQLFETFGPSRYSMKFIGKAAILVLLGIGLFFIAMCPENLFYIRWIISFLLITITMCIYKGFRLMRTLYMSVFVFMLIELMEVPGQFAEMLLNTHFPDVQIWSLLSMLVTKGLLIGLIFSLKRIFIKKMSLFSLNGAWMAFAFIPFGTLLVIGIFLAALSGVKLHMGWVVFMVTALLIVNIAAFYMIADMIQRQIYILNEQTIKEQNENRLKSYETIAECLDEQRSRTHEYKNYIHCIYYLMEMGKQEEVRKYVNDLRYGMHLKNVVVCETKHILIDAIVNAKHKEATAKGIKFSVQAEKLHNCTIQDEDIIVIISNLLNNAVEAAEKLEENPYIFVKIKETEDTLQIQVKNSHTGQIQVADGEIATGKKEDSANHGFGIKNVKTAVNKYGGQCNISYTDSEFTVDVEISL